MDTEIFFPTKSEEDQAKAVCSRCPATETCLKDTMEWEKGLRADLRFGIFAGLTGEERARISEKPAAQCIYGHPLTLPEQYIIRPDGKRCRQCKRDRDRDTKRRERAS